MHSGGGGAGGSSRRGGGGGLTTIAEQASEQLAFKAEQKLFRHKLEAVSRVSLVGE